MKEVLMGLVTPFKKLTPRQTFWSTLSVVSLILLLWSTSGSEFIPTPMEIIRSFPRLQEKDIIRNFIKSFGFCFSAIGWATIFSLTLGYLSVLPLFSTLCEFLRKFRFLPSVGFSFLFMKMTGNIDQQASWMMIFGVTTWLSNSMVGTALSITPEEVMYAKSIRLNRWQRMRELLIFGKAAEMFDCIIQNFALAWMLLATIENITKASGGIGVVLAESNKYYKFDEVYFLQIMILTSGIVLDYLLRKVKKFIFPHLAKE